MKKATRRTIDKLRKDGHRVACLEHWAKIPRSEKGGYWATCLNFASVLDLGTESDPTVAFIIVLRDQDDLERDTRSLLNRGSVPAAIAATMAGGGQVRVVTWTNTVDIFEGAWAMQSRWLRLAWDRVCIVGEAEDKFAMRPVDPEPKGDAVRYPEREDPRSWCPSAIALAGWGPLIHCRRDVGHEPPHAGPDPLELMVAVTWTGPDRPDQTTVAGKPLQKPSATDTGQG